MSMLGSTNTKENGLEALIVKWLVMRKPSQIQECELSVKKGKEC